MAEINIEETISEMYRNASAKKRKEMKDYEWGEILRHTQRVLMFNSIDQEDDQNE